MDNYSSKSKSSGDIDDRVIDSITVISKGEVEAIWGKNCPGEGESLFPLTALQEVKSDFRDYLIIYLSGISIHEQIQISVKRGLNIQAGSIDLLDLQKEGQAGYYLVKLKGYQMSYITDEQKMNAPPPLWRRAKLREASEIILNIYSILRKKIYARDWHICTNYQRKGAIDMVRFSTKKEKELILGTRQIARAPMNINSITIRKLSE